jgi:hypothetical protein
MQSPGSPHFSEDFMDADLMSTVEDDSVEVAAELDTL